MKSSIIDVPRRHDQDDLFGIKVYQDALIKYIKLTDTPITIALQGEWGSGKTSLMNLLRWNLCEVDNAPYFPVWINTWQYSLMKTPQQAIISILEGIVNQIGALNPNAKKNESMKKIGGLFKKMATVGAKVAVGVAGIDGGVVDDLVGGDEAQSDINQLKEEIGKLINEAIAENPSKVGFTFYIDDLDRIDPPVAVEILELLKNIFDRSAFSSSPSIMMWLSFPLSVATNPPWVPSPFFVAKIATDERQFSIISPPCDSPTKPAAFMALV